MKRSRRWALGSLRALPNCDTTAVELVPGEQLLGAFLPMPPTRSSSADHGWGWAAVEGVRGALSCGAFRYSCGQYLYLNVPAIAPAE